MDAAEPLRKHRAIRAMVEAHVRRREFLASASGVLLGFHLERPVSAATPLPPFDAWIRIHPGGRVVLRVAKVEMGQGIHTALAQILAEELDVDWADVAVEQAPVDPSRYDHLTVGSDSVRSLWLPLRQAGALGRKLLVSAAAARWQVRARDCRTEPGRVLGPGGRQLSYAELVAQAAALRASTSPTVQLKSPERFRLIGAALRRIDAPDKVNGTASFGIDVRIPGMLRAVVARCPVPGGQLQSFDSTAALFVRGVRAVFPIEPVGPDAFTRGGVAVVAQNSWAALEGRRRLRIEWTGSRHASLSSRSVLAELHANTRKAGRVVREEGNVPAVLNNSRRIVESVFELPFLAHVTMEPMNATVQVRQDGAEAWLPTQNASDARSAIAHVLGIPAAAVLVHQTLVGGGFGRRDATDFAVEAAQIAAAVKAPVQVLWSREDDLRFDRFRPAAVHVLRASLDDEGRPESWLDRLSSVSIAALLEPAKPDSAPSTEVGGAREIPYDVGAFRMEYTPVSCGVPVGWWRSVEDSINAFAVECFIDDLAAGAGDDPYRYRMRLLRPGARVRDREGGVIEIDRLRRVLSDVVTRAGWPKTPERTGLGLSCHCCRGSYIAVIARVERFAVQQLWASVDCGLVVNPLGAEAQVCGGLLFGLSAALYEEVSIEDGQVRIGNFNDYPVLRMDASPRVEVRLLPSRAPPTGVGEIAVAPVAPAVANAVFALTGERPRRLPLRLMSRRGSPGTPPTP
jgi:isoquinoline 1-oxidoreductase subunit beta